MIKKLFGRKTPHVDPDELDRQTAEVNAMLEREGPRMTFVANWLKHRNGKNGFGEDFDITFYPPEDIDAIYRTAGGGAL